MELSGSPVVAINRALALAEVQGAAAGLDHWNIHWRLAPDGVSTVLGRSCELLARTGASASAHHAYEVQLASSEIPPSVASSRGAKRL